jgi:glycosyltransferase involved in cell wall biosynthesis
VPVICTKVGGLPEVVRDGVNGIVVEPESAAALKQALLDLDRDRLDRLAQGAKASSCELSWNAYARALEVLCGRLKQQTPAECAGV